MTRPTTPEGLCEISSQVMEKWNFPHTCGALDGKHVACKAPPKSGSVYYNYKEFYSIMLIALIDADCTFLWAVVGSPGSSSDAQIYNESEFQQMAEDGTIGFPASDPLPNNYKDVPYFFVSDDAFGLRKHMIKTYTLCGLTEEERIFNYRLSRAKRVIENAFGILANRFQDQNTAPPIHRQDHPEGAHCSSQLDENEVSNSAEPAARP
ncbi:uncharacterized protein LOC125374866 [Haliotis rufescens]|uniref:uncharacterized protein LOC125374866 n=1 Tax=Haliotis rufescens TaxID=6454 RepID=UPI00201F7D14|nr:uncharacterized protein LOC125374866 [Haliotis rufescens]